MSEEERQAKYNELVLKATDYAYNKSIEGGLKKKLDSDNTAVKTLMELLQLDEVKTQDGSTVCYSVTTQESLDEAQLIMLLHNVAPSTQCIKTKEYIDMDILESELYHGDLSEEALNAIASCTRRKEIPKLTIKKTKKGK